MKRRAFILSLAPAIAGLLSCKKSPTIYDPEGFKEKLEPPSGFDNAFSGYKITPDNSKIIFTIDGRIVAAELTPESLKTGEIHIKG